ncbi:hypothetical protein [Halorubrum sp. Eb13]|uniref:hypothetical protein n=1 Tax=Halorubrum sp. Eb13 TaxID=1383843 RepID=UPI000B986C2D|nr:hypothetical protein [Halorubrum sp. Eb13]OYR49585.1 hypothetical protein DJ75_00970 [Halorubrum sp. Eb13]
MSQTDYDLTTVTATDHPRVFRNGPAFSRGELEVANDIADALDDQWRVVITMGPYRGYNIHYDLKPDSHIVHLDFYSVRPATGYDRQQVIADIQQGVKQAQGR